MCSSVDDTIYKCSPAIKVSPLSDQSLHQHIPKVQIFYKPIVKDWKHKTYYDVMPLTAFCWNQKKQYVTPN